MASIFEQYPHISRCSFNFTVIAAGTYLNYNKFCMALTEAVWRCSGKKLLLKFTQNYHENTCVGDSFSGRPATLLERDSNTGVFMWILGHF